MLFLSYSREDRNDALKLAAELLQSNIPLYRDPPAPAGDAFWRDKINEQLRATDVLVVLWSKNARRSPWVDQEIRAFCGRIIVIVLDTKPWPYAEPNHETRIVFDKRTVLPAIRSLYACRKTSDEASVITPEYLGEEEIFARRRESARSACLELAQFSRQAGRATRITSAGDGILARNEWDGGILRQIKARDGNVFYLATEPVTNAQYSAFVSATGFSAPPTACRDEFSRPEKPAVGVTWFEASAYAAWVGGVLPTEDEWMRAATYFNGQSEYATARGEIGPQEAHYGCAFAAGSPVAAKRFAPTPGGFFNLCGNTWDWCSSGEGPYHVIKGGGFMDSAEFCAIRARYRNAPLDRDCTVGFRIAVR